MLIDSAVYQLIKYVVSIYDDEQTICAFKSRIYDPLKPMETKSMELEITRRRWGDS